MTELSRFHRLVYAGVDMTGFSKTVTAYVGRYASECYHARQHCWGTPRPRRGETVSIDPSKVVASKACSACFDEFWNSSDPNWDAYKLLSSGFTSKNARFLRTALNEKSRKNTPEAAAAHIGKLEEVKGSLYRPKDGDALVAHDDLVRRIDDRIRAIRRSLHSDELRETVTLTACALAASFDDHGRRSSLLARLERVSGLTTWDRREVLASGLTAWAEAVGKTTPLADASSAFASGVKNSSHFSAVFQLEGVSVHRAPEPGESILKWSKEAWERALSEELTSLTEKLETSFEEFRSDKEMVLSHIYVPQGNDEKSLHAKTFLSLVELHALRRHQSEAVLFMPRGLHKALLRLSKEFSHHVERATCPAAGISETAADTAASLYDFNPRSALGGLQGALDAAAALEA